MTTADYLIKGVSLPDGKKTDIAIASGVISSVGSGFKGEASNVIDAKDCVILPGLVDLHTHLREPGREDAGPPSPDPGCHLQQHGAQVI